MLLAQFMQREHVPPDAASPGQCRLDAPGGGPLAEVVCALRQPAQPQGIDPLRRVAGRNVRVHPARLRGTGACGNVSRRGTAAEDEAAPSLCMFPHAGTPGVPLSMRVPTSTRRPPPQITTAAAQAGHSRAADPIVARVAEPDDARMPRGSRPTLKSSTAAAQSDSRSMARPSPSSLAQRSL